MPALKLENPMKVRHIVKTPPPPQQRQRRDDNRGGQGGGRGQGAGGRGGQGGGGRGGQGGGGGRGPVASAGAGAPAGTRPGGPGAKPSGEKRFGGPSAPSGGKDLFILFFIFFMIASLVLRNFKICQKSLSKYLISNIFFYYPRIIEINDGNICSGNRMINEP